jgi:hypothetical protein
LRWRPPGEPDPVVQRSYDLCAGMRRRQLVSDASW